MSVSNSNIGEDHTISFYKEVKDSSQKVSGQRKITPLALQSLNTYTADGSGDSQNTYFGIGISIVNSTKILIGSKDKKSHPVSSLAGGSVFEFVYNPTDPDADGGVWVQTTAINPSDIASINSPTSMDFGYSVSSYDGYVAVGAPGTNYAATNDQNRGAVYLYQSKSDGYHEQAKLQPISEQILYFGQVLKFDQKSNKLAVGVPLYDSTASSDCGAVFVFKSSSTGGWEREAILTSSESGASHKIGHAVDFSGSYILAGAPAKSASGISGAGKAYLFNSSSSGGWNELSIFQSSNPTSFGYYGESVSLFSNNRAIIGEQNGKSHGNTTGSAEIIKFSSEGVKTVLTTLKNTITGSALTDFGRFVSSYSNGSYVAISRPSAATGASNNTDGHEEGRRAVLIYSSGSNGEWNLYKTLTRDQSKATYYSSSPGSWFNAFNSTAQPVALLDMNDGIVLHGLPAAADSNFRPTSGSPFGYNVGEFRVWQDEIITVTTQPPFSVGGAFPWNLRGQTTANAYSTTVHKGSGLKS